MTQLPIFRVHIKKLENYFCHVFGWEDFDFNMATEGTPGLIPEYIVNPNLPGCGDIDRQANAIRNGRRSRNVLLILTILCADGFIPAGKYLIDTKPEPPLLETYKTLLQQTGTPESKECSTFRATHNNNKELRRIISEIDTQVLQALKELTSAGHQ
jgi:hypothetical protein